MAPPRRPRWLSIVARCFGQYFGAEIETTTNYSDMILNDYVQRYPEQNRIRLKFIRWSMNSGKFWQALMGHCDDVIDLGNKGLDLLSHERRFVMKLKNSTKSDNSSSRRMAFQKLAKFKETHPTYEIIYGAINDCQFPEGVDRQKDGARVLTGKKLLYYVFGASADEIVACVRAESQAYFEEEPVTEEDDDDQRWVSTVPSPRRARARYF
jgi:hypothetical protein